MTETMQSLRRSIAIAAALSAVAVGVSVALATKAWAQEASDRFLGAAVDMGGGARYSGARSDVGGGYLIPHPAGCPRSRFCGCGAAVRVFGSPRRDLWPSSAWFRFPRTSPAGGMVAVRRGHVFVLEQHIAGNVWLVTDYNSGGRLSRRHPRSISGFAIVNPHARLASL